MTNIAPPTIDELVALARAGTETKRATITAPILNRDINEFDGETLTVKVKRLVGGNVAIGKCGETKRPAVYLMHPDDEGQAIGVMATLPSNSMLKSAEGILLAWMWSKISGVPPVRHHREIKGDIFDPLRAVSALVASGDLAVFDDAYREHRDEMKAAKDAQERVAAHEAYEILAIELELMPPPVPVSGSIRFDNHPVTTERAIKRLGPFALTDPARKDLHCTRLLEDGRAIATDGHRIAVLPTEGVRAEAFKPDGKPFKSQSWTAFKSMTKNILKNVECAPDINDVQEVIDGPFLLAVIERMCGMHEAMETKKGHFVDFHVTDGQLRVSFTPLDAKHPNALDRRVTVTLGRTSRPHACDGPLALGGVFGVNPFYMRDALKGITGPVVLGYKWDARHKTQLIEVQRDGEVHIIAGSCSKSCNERLSKRFNESL